MMVARAWREQQTRYRIIGTQCGKCEHLSYPPRRVCPECKSREYESFAFKGEGIIVTFTQIYSVPEGHEEDVPITLGIIQLDEGPSMLSQIVDYDKLAIGDEVEMVLRKVDSHHKEQVIHYAAKFRPKATWEISE